MFDVTRYWDTRYLKGGNSGAGSRGAAGEAKARQVNAIIARYGVYTVIDWGCGDGEVASYIHAPHYIGLDVSGTALDICKVRMAGEGRVWRWYDGDTPPALPQADLSLSLDVIYHLIPDALYRRHMELVFGAAPLVCINSSCRDEAGRAHVLHRTFTDDVPSDFEVLMRPADPEPVGLWVFRRRA